MTLKAWGRFSASSALDIYRLLTSPPHDGASLEQWYLLHTLEPPFWGSLMDHAGNVAYLITRGYRVWSWDDHGVVLSAKVLEPPHGIHYRSWDFFFHDHQEDPTQPNPVLPINLLDGFDEDPDESLTPTATPPRAASRRG